MTAAEIAERLVGVRREKNGGYVGRCPAHDDREPSLRVAEGRDGRVLIKCRAGCETNDVLRALSLTERDLFPDQPATAATPMGEVVYPYSDELGHVLFEVVRSIHPVTGEKRFRQRRSDGHGGTIYNTDGVRRVIYRMPEVLEAIALGKRLYICEGEKDSDRLWSLGLAATTAPMGAGKWHAQHAAYLQNTSDIVILADNDEAGRQHARVVADTIPGARIIEFPELPEKGDVSDWLDRGHIADELIRRCDPVRHLTLVDRGAARSLATENERPIDSVPTPFDSWNRACLSFGGGRGLARGWHIIVGAPSNKGKSMLALNCAHAALLGGYSVAYILLEGSRRDLLSRFYPLAANENARLLQPGRFYEAARFAAVAESVHARLEQQNVRFFVTDKSERTLPFVLAVMREAVDTGCALIIVDYLQLIHVPGITGVYDTTVRVSGDVSATAASLGVVTLALSQYNRPAVNARDGAGLTIHGLAGGGAWENDADQVVILDPTNAKRDGFTTESVIRLGKNRHGPVEEFPVIWDFRTFRVTEPPIRDTGRLTV